jgi:hypothetical protein
MTIIAGGNFRKQIIRMIQEDLDEYKKEEAIKRLNNMMKASPNWAEVVLTEYYHSVPKKVKNKAFEIVLEDIDLTHRISFQCNSLSYNERKKIYNKYNKQIQSNLDTFEGFVNYCVLFKEHIGKQEKEKIVNLIKDKGILEFRIPVLRSALEQIDFPNKLSDFLESYIVDYELRK